MDFCSACASRQSIKFYCILCRLFINWNIDALITATKRWRCLHRKQCYARSSRGIHQQVPQTDVQIGIVAGSDRIHSSYYSIQHCACHPPVHTAARSSCWLVMARLHGATAQITLVLLTWHVWWWYQSVSAIMFLCPFMRHEHVSLFFFVLRWQYRCCIAWSWAVQAPAARILI